MTGQEIKQLAESYVDDTIEDVDARLWLNDWLSDCARDSEVYKSATITAADALLPVPLPSDLVEISSILLSDGRRYSGPVVVDHRGICLEAGGYTLYYKKRPDVLVALSDSPDLHQGLHRIGAVFLAAKYKFKDDDENPDARRLMMDYERGKMRALGDVRARYQQSEVIDVYGF